MLGLIVFGVCLLTYLAGGQSQPGNDATANVRQALQLIEHGGLFFTPEDNPKMFVFAEAAPGEKKTARIRDWQIPYQGRPARDAYAQGKIRVDQPAYYLVPTRHPGKYANTFGVGAGLFAAPIVIPASLVVHDLANNPDLLWWLAKIAAALSVAGTVFILYLAALGRFSPRASAFLALAYGLGTCAFSVSSQALWQHGPCEMFLALGAYFLMTNSDKRNHLLCGLAFALATACRPTAALVVICVGVHLLVVDRRRLFWFGLGSLPIAMALVAYSAYAFGTFMSVGQLKIAAEIAKAKTGQPDIWQTPLWEGVPGLLLSPARGLFVYSPLALFAVWGAGRAFRDSAWRDLRPLAVAAVLLLGVAAKRFDWWGGWCFGYRPIVDVVILLAFLSFPLLETLSSRRPLQVICGVLFAYSFAIQLLGAFVYDVAAWNARVVWDVKLPGTNHRLSFDDPVAAKRYIQEHGGQPEKRELSVDARENRWRLWSLTDSPTVYFLANFSRAIEARKAATAEFLHDDG